MIACFQGAFAWFPKPGSSLRMAFPQNSAGWIRRCFSGSRWMAICSFHSSFCRQNACRLSVYIPIRILIADRQGTSFSAVPGKSGFHWWLSCITRCIAGCLHGSCRGFQTLMNKFAKRHWRLHVQPPFSGYTSIIFLVFPDDFGERSFWSIHSRIDAVILYRRCLGPYCTIGHENIKTNRMIGFIESV